MKSELEKNIDTEISMLREISNYSIRLRSSTIEETKLLEGAIDSLKRGMKIVNGAIPKILETQGAANKLPETPLKETKKMIELEEVSFTRVDSKFAVVLKSSDKRKFLRELRISENLMKKVRKKDWKGKERHEEFKSSRGYLKLANKFFLNRAIRDVELGKYNSLAIEIRKSNLEILLESYVAAMFFTTVLSAVLSVIVYVLLIFIDVNFAAPFLALYSNGYLLRAAKLVWIPLAVPLGTFVLMYLYPRVTICSHTYECDIWLWNCSRRNFQNNWA